MANNKIKILLIEEGSSIITLRVIRCLGVTNKYEIHVLSLLENQITSFRYSRYLSSYLVHEPKDDEHALSLILDTTLSKHADIVMPLMEKQTRIIARNQHAFKGMCVLPPLPDFCTLELVINKYLLAKWMYNEGFSGTQVINVRHLMDQVDFSDSLTFPLLLKPFWGSSGEGIYRIDEPCQLKKIIESGLSTTELLLQPYFPGNDIDLSALVEEGRIIVYTIQRPVRRSKKFKYSKKIEFIEDSTLLRFSEQIFKKLNYSGIAHLDFRHNSITNIYNLVDFNARYWSTITGSLRAGINFPDLACKIAGGGKVDPHDFRRIRFLSSENLFYILFNCFSFSRNSLQFLINNELYYGISDPLPMIYNFVNLLKAKFHWYLGRNKCRH